MLDNETTEDVKDLVENNVDEEIKVMHETEDDSEKYEALVNEIQSLKEKLLRAMAETENVKDRYLKQIEEAKKYSIAQFAKDIAGTIDSLQKALQYKENEQLSPETKNILTGVEMTEKELLSILKKYKIEAIIPLKGDVFDYRFHQAVTSVEDAELESGAIAEVMQVGYKLEDRLLRPAMVTVVK